MPESKFTYSLSEIGAAAQWLISQIPEKTTIWCFEGAMGSGKTTLISAIAKELGVEEPVSSPTFSLVNEYQTQLHRLVYHFDFYRIKSVDEAFDIGVEEYLFGGNLCLIEWPSQISTILSEISRATININQDGNGRQLQLTLVVK